MSGQVNMTLPVSEWGDTELVAIARQGYALSAATYSRA